VLLCLAVCLCDKVADYVRALELRNARIVLVGIAEHIGVEDVVDDLNLLIVICILLVPVAQPAPNNMLYYSLLDLVEAATGEIETSNEVLFSEVRADSLLL
jgi:hypothetical protein